MNQIATVGAAQKRFATAMLAGCIVLAGAFAARADNTPPANTATAITRTPKNAQLKLSFDAPGVVMNVGVVEGQPVKKGQLLAEQDDRQDVAALESMKLDAASMAQINFSVTQYGVKKVQLARKIKMLSENVASKSEVEEARLDADKATAEIDLAKLAHQQKQLDVKKQQFKIDDEKILSPIDGIVQKVNIGPGEMANPQDPGGSIVVVNNNPLWAEMHMDAQRALKLKVGQTLEVQYPDQKKWQPAKVIFLDPEVDAASDTRLVRLQMPNPDGMPSGMQVKVKLAGSMVASKE